MAVEEELNRGRYSRPNALNVRVSPDVHKKVILLNQYVRYSEAHRLWGKDHKLLKYNIINVPNAKNYKVLLAMGRR